MDDPAILTMTIDFVRKALPKILSHRLLLKKALGEAEMLIDRHCGKARYDFSERLGQLVQTYRKDLTRTISSAQNDVMRALEAGVKSKQHVAVETTLLETRLRDKIKNLNEIKGSIQKTALTNI